MIPKIIHLCWLSGDPYPPEIQKCLDSWKIHLPDYEIWLWDTKRFDINSTLWTKQAFEAKKYAFAADYIRLYALYNFGGIYLDADVIVYKSFNDLLILPYFVGQDYTGAIEAAVIGAQARQNWIGRCLDYYNNRSFIDKGGNYDMCPLPVIMLNCLFGTFYFRLVHNIYDHITPDENLIYIFEKDFFNSRNSIGVNKTPKSYCAHNFMGAWTSKKSKSFFYRIIPKFIIRFAFFISHHTFKRGAIHHYDPIYLQDKQNPKIRICHEFHS